MVRKKTHAPTGPRIPVRFSGGCLLSIGSVAGIALLRTAKEQYTLASPLKWPPVIALGHAAGIVTHDLVNG